jgi:hypothetical protein
MTEAEWNSCTDPQKMLEWLRNQGSLPERKARLFAVACCRRVQYMLDQIGAEAIEVSERYSEGRATAAERDAAENLAWWGADGLNYEADRVWYAGWAAHSAVAGNAGEAVRLAVMARGDNGEAMFQCSLLRDLFGPLPFYEVHIDAAWLQWNDGIILRMATAIYEERQLPSGHLDAARLAVLADALEEASCTDEKILGHLRGPGRHVRGCWLIDLVLSKS